MAKKGITTPTDTNENNMIALIDQKRQIDTMFSEIEKEAILKLTGDIPVNTVAERREAMNIVRTLLGSCQLMEWFKKMVQNKLKKSDWREMRDYILSRAPVEARIEQSGPDGGPIKVEVIDNYKPVKVIDVK